MEYRQYQTTPEGVNQWHLTLEDGREVSWDRFFVGPKVLSDRQLHDAADTLLGTDLASIPLLASHCLCPTIEQGNESARALIIHSATRTTRGFEGDLSDLVANRDPYDVATYLETRAVSLAKPDDVVVGRTAPWRAEVERRGATHIDIADTSYYYLTQALVYLALRHREMRVPAIESLVHQLVMSPEIIIRLYALDADAQLFLVWLCREARLTQLYVDANGPEVAQRWNRKGHIHPHIDKAETIAVPRPGKGAWLSAEAAQSELEVELAPRIHSLPGYRIDRNTECSEFTAQVLSAARLLAHRHGVSECCLKPTEAGDGARIVGPVETTDAVRLQKLALEAYIYGDDYLVEAYVSYRRFAVADREFKVAPSGHIAGGQLLDGMTVQLMRDMSWEGNAYVDRASCESIGLSEEEYSLMRSDMVAIARAFRSNGRSDDWRSRLVIGGIDFAVGSVSQWGIPTEMVAATDFNLSSHGAVYLRELQAKVDLREGVYAATRVFRPALHAGPSDIAGELSFERANDLELIAAVPGRWGMLGAIGGSTRTAIEGALHAVSRLDTAGLVAKL